MAAQNVTNYTNTSRPELDWIKGNRTDLDPIVKDCVLLAKDGDMISLTDSKSPASAVLQFKPSEIQAFVQSAKDGDFDHLVA